MQALAENDDASAQAVRGLPDARIVWLRAQVEARHAAAERAHWVDVACAMVVCITAAVWAAWNWGAVGGAIAEALDWLALEAWPAFWSEFYAYGPANAPVLFSLALTVIAGVMVGVAYPLLLRE